jgi:hypothetical protein
MRSVHKALDVVKHKLTTVNYLNYKYKKLMFYEL